MLSPIPTQLDFLTISEAAKFLHVSEQTLRNWTDEGLVPAFVTHGGHRRYTEKDLKWSKLIIGCINRGEEPNIYSHFVVIAKEKDGRIKIVAQRNPQSSLAKEYRDVSIKICGLENFLSRSNSLYETGVAKKIRNSIDHRGRYTVGFRISALSRSKFDKEMALILEESAEILDIKLDDLIAKFESL